MQKCQEYSHIAKADVEGPMREKNRQNIQWFPGAMVPILNWIIEFMNDP